MNPWAYACSRGRLPAPCLTVAARSATFWTVTLESLVSQAQTSDHPAANRSSAGVATRPRGSTAALSIKRDTTTASTAFPSSSITRDHPSDPHGPRLLILHSTYDSQDHRDPACCLRPSRRTGAPPAEAREEAAQDTSQLPNSIPRPRGHRAPQSREPAPHYKSSRATPNRRRSLQARRTFKLPVPAVTAIA